MDAECNVDETTSTDGDGSLDPREAASMLERTQREARRKLTSDKPMLSVFSALVVLAVYGAIWSSSRGMIVVAAGGAFAGPVNVWGVLAVAGCLLLLAQGLLRFRWLRAGSIARSNGDA